VLQPKDGAICDVFPDGRKQWVKRIEPPTPVNPGAKFTLG
jgi:hypothetical protein